MAQLVSLEGFESCTRHCQSGVIARSSGVSLAAWMMKWVTPGFSPPRVRLACSSRSPGWSSGRLAIVSSRGKPACSSPAMAWAAILAVADRTRAPANRLRPAHHHQGQAVAQAQAEIGLHKPGMGDAAHVGIAVVGCMPNCKARCTWASSSRAAASGWLKPGPGADRRGRKPSSSSRPESIPGRYRSPAVERILAGQGGVHAQSACG